MDMTEFRRLREADRAAFDRWQRACRDVEAAAAELERCYQQQQETFAEYQQRHAVYLEGISRTLDGMLKEGGTDGSNESKAAG